MKLIIILGGFIADKLNLFDCSEIKVCCCCFIYRGSFIARKSFCYTENDETNIAHSFLSTLFTTNIAIPTPTGSTYVIHKTVELCCCVSRFYNHIKTCCIVEVIGRVKGTPTLGCSIEIPLVYIYIYMYACQFVYGKPIQKIHMPNYMGRSTWPKHVHTRSQFWAVKTDL